MQASVSSLLPSSQASTPSCTTVSPAGSLTEVAAGVGVDGVSIIARFDADLDDPVAAASDLTGVGAGVAVDVVAVVADLHVLTYDPVAAARLEARWCSRRRRCGCRHRRLHCPARCRHRTAPPGRRWSSHRRLRCCRRRRLQSAWIPSPQRAQRRRSCKVSVAGVTVIAGLDACLDDSSPHRRRLAGVGAGVAVDSVAVIAALAFLKSSPRRGAAH